MRGSGLRLSVFADADYAAAGNDRRSVSGYDVGRNGHRLEEQYPSTGFPPNITATLDTDLRSFAAAV